MCYSQLSKITVKGELYHHQRHDSDARTMAVMSITEQPNCKNKRLLVGFRHKKGLVKVLKNICLG